MLRTLMFLLTLCPAALLADDATPREAYDEARKLLEEGESKGDATALRKARKLFVVAAADEGLAVLAHYHSGYSSLKELQLTRSVTGRKAVLNRAISEFEKVRALDGKMAEALALLASCYGQKINLDSSQMMVLGPKIGALMTEASTLEPANPRVSLIAAISLYYTPPNFGGSREKALEKLNQAAKQFENWKSKDKDRPSWGQAEVHAWIGLAHLDKGELKKARAAFEKALAIDSDYSFVRGSLLPRLEAAEKKA